MNKIDAFWLHIKKSGGTTIKNCLGGNYSRLLRQAHCPSFIQSEIFLWNDILNNSRANLGEYQLKRCFFAREFLYKSSWEKLYSWTVMRDPIERVKSGFDYLMVRGNRWNLGKNSSQSVLVRSSNIIRYRFNKSWAFDYFLDLVAISLDDYAAVDKHFACHVAPVFSDISDESGNILIKKIFILESLDNSIEEISSIYGDSTIVDRYYENKFRNRNKRSRFDLKTEQLKKIEELFQDDLSLYETMKYSSEC